MQLFTTYLLSSLLLALFFVVAASGSEPDKGSSANCKSPSFQKAVAFEKAHDHRQAVETLNELLKRSPDNIEARTLRKKLYVDVVSRDRQSSVTNGTIGNPREQIFIDPKQAAVLAVEDLELLVKVTPSERLLWHELSYLKLPMNEEEHVAMCTRALNAGADPVVFLTERAGHFEKLGKTKEAFNDYGKAIEKAAPTYRKQYAYEQRANAFIRQKDFNAALADYDAACKKAGNQGYDLSIGRAFCLEMLGHHNEALSICNRLLKADAPYRFTILMIRRHVFEQLGKVDLANQDRAEMKHACNKHDLSLDIQFPADWFRKDP